MISVNIKSNVLASAALSHFLPDTVSSSNVVPFLNSHDDIPPSVICYRNADATAWLFATDRIRSIPLFYCVLSNEILVSDTIQLFLPSNSSTLKTELSFLTTGFTTGSATLCKDVKQLQAGEYLWLDKDGIKTGFYHRYLTNSFFKEDVRILKKNLSTVFDKVFTALIEQLDGRMAVIPLTGGYDSRLITYWLHRLEYPNIVCYTFGRPGNKEVENARKTAEKLNLRWFFIDYTRLGISNYLDDDRFADYYEYMANHAAMFFMQDYFAVKYLLQNDMVPKDAVFLPGHSGDFLGGSHLRSVLGKKLTEKQIAIEIYKMHYGLVEVSNMEKRELIAKIGQEIAEGYPAHLLFEDWDLREFQAKFNVNSARIFAWFGYSFYLPLWDDRMVEFFKHVPFEHKLYKRLYNSVLTELFETAGIHFQNEIQSSRFAYWKDQVKRLAFWYLPILRKLKRLPVNDAICYREITDCMKKELNEKGITLRRNYSYNGVIVQWYLHKIHPS